MTSFGTGARRNTIGSRRRLRKALNKLAVGTPAESLSPLLGLCSLRRPVDQHDDFRQQIYVTKHADVDVYIEPDLDTVVAFCITVIDPKFIFDISTISFGVMNKLRLGQSTFAHASISNGPGSGVFWWNGARDAGYAEAHYAGDPGGYQTYVLAWVKTGVGALAYDEVPEQHQGGLRSGLFADGELHQGLNASEHDFDLAEWNWFRARTKVNTLQVIGPGWPPRSDGKGLPRPGVHGDITRVLRDPPRPLLTRLRRRVAQFEDKPDTNDALSA